MVIPKIKEYRIKKYSIKNRLLWAASIFMLALCLPAGAQDFRVGVVDTERVLRESAPALKAEKRIEQEFKTRDAEIKALSKQIKDIQTLLEKEGVTLSESERRNKERELANLNMNMQRTQREFNEDLNLRKHEELSIVLEIANKAIKAIAESEKYDLILQEKVYHNPKIDITEKVLQYMALEKSAAP